MVARASCAPAASATRGSSRRWPPSRASGSCRVASPVARPTPTRPCRSTPGQTISQPYMVAVMTELLATRPGDRILEIGTGLRLPGGGARERSAAGSRRSSATRRWRDAARAGSPTSGYGDARRDPGRRRQPRRPGRRAVGRDHRDRGRAGDPARAARAAGRRRPARDPGRAARSPGPDRRDPPRQRLDRAPGRRLRLRAARRRRAASPAERGTPRSRRPRSVYSAGHDPRLRRAPSRTTSRSRAAG